MIAGFAAISIVFDRKNRPFQGYVGGSGAAGNRLRFGLSAVCVGSWRLGEFVLVVAGMGSRLDRFLGVWDGGRGVAVYVGDGIPDGSAIR